MLRFFYLYQRKSIPKEETKKSWIQLYILLENVMWKHGLKDRRMKYCILIIALCMIEYAKKFYIEMIANSPY